MWWLKVRKWDGVLWFTSDQQIAPSSKLSGGWIKKSPTQLWSSDVPTLSVHWFERRSIKSDHYLSQSHTMLQMLHKRRRSYWFAGAAGLIVWKFSCHLFNPFAASLNWSDKHCTKCFALYSFFSLRWWWKLRMNCKITQESLWAEERWWICLDLLSGAEATAMLKAKWLPALTQNVLPPRPLLSYCIYYLHLKN